MWSRRWRVDLTQVERKKMISSTMWVLLVGRIPKRYLGQAPGGFASWAGLMGFGLVSVSFIFFLLLILFLFSILLF
jgi:hypothetical protein